MTGPGGTDRPVFDPRHDARFQRGYQPGDAPGAPDRPGLIGTPPASTVAAAAGEDSVVDFDALAFDGDVFQDELESSRWNPFIVVLWAASILLIAAALTLQWQAATNAFGNYSYTGSGPLPVEMIIQQLSYSIAPAVLIAGFATMSGLMFWHAAAWRTRRRRMVEGR